MDTKRAFVIGAVVGPLVVSFVGWVISSVETDSSPPKESPQQESLTPNSVVEPEPNPLKMGLMHQAHIPKRFLLRDLRNARLDAEKVRIIQAIGHSKFKDATADLGEIAETERGSLRRAAIDALGRVGGTHAVDILIGLTESNLKAVRHQALHGLGRISSPGAIDWLKDIAESNLLRMGNQALQAIAQSGDDSQSSYFVRMMNNQKVEIASSAARALATLGTPRSRKILIGMAQRDELGSVRLAAIRSLCHFDAPDVRRLVKKMIFDERVQVAKAAIESYAKMSGEGVSRTLSELAQTGRRPLQRPATKGLGDVGSADARDELIHILFTEETHTMFVAAETLATVGDEESVEALTEGLKRGRNLTQAVLRAMDKAPSDESLLRAVSDVLVQNKNELCLEAAKVLATHLGAEAVPDILLALEKARKHHKEFLCDVLASIDGNASKKALLAIVHKEDGFLRSEALNALVNHDRLHPSVARDLAIEQLSEAKGLGPSTRLVDVLASLDDPEADEHLMRLLKTSKNFDVRSIISAISTRGSAHLLTEVIDQIRMMPKGQRRQNMLSSLDLDRPDSRKFLRGIASGTGQEAAAVLSGFAWRAPHEVRDIAFGAIQSDDANMRMSGLNVLRGINGTEEINAFADLLKDTNAGVKMQAVAALGHSQDPYAMDLMINAFEDGDGTIREASAYHIASSRHPRALDVLVEATLSRGKTSRSFFHAIQQMDTRESKQALELIKEQAPEDNAELQADILNRELEQEASLVNKILGESAGFSSNLRIYHLD
jgi:HEAT repeat protein